MHAQLGEGPNYESVNQLKEIMRNNFYFFRIKPDLKTDFYALVEQLERYAKIQSSTHTMILQKIRDAVKKLHKRDAQVSPDQVWLALYILNYAIQLDKINLEQTILRKISPSDFIENVKRTWKDAVVKVFITGEKKEISDFEALRKIVSDEVEKEALYQTEKKERCALVESLKAFLKEVEPFITE